MPPKTTVSDPKQTLNSHLQTYPTLLTQFLTTLQTPSTTPSSSPKRSQIASPPHPLDVLRDSATLLKAHVTKLSLLALNKPFTASAVDTELKSAIETCIVGGMMGGVEILGSDMGSNEDEGEEKKKDGEKKARCEYLIWGVFMVKEARIRVARVVREMQNLIAEVQAVADAESVGTTNGKGQKKEDNKSTTTVAGRDTLSSTGVVWEACDKLLELEKLGVAGLAVQKAEQYRTQLLDALEELKEWSEEEDDDEDDEDDEEDNDAASAGSNEDAKALAHDDFDDIFGKSKPIPKSNTTLRPQLDLSLKRIKTISMLYQALSKRRFKVFTLSVSTDSQAQKNIKTLDELLDKLHQIPETIDDLASAFYDLDEEEAKTLLESCIEIAKDAATSVEKNWKVEDDEFTAWCAKWRDAVSTQG